MSSSRSEIKVSLGIESISPRSYKKTFYEKNKRSYVYSMSVPSCLTYVPCPFYSAFPCSFRCTRPSVFPQRVFGGLPPIFPLHLLWVLFAFTRPPGIPPDTPLAILMHSLVFPELPTVGSRWVSFYVPRSFAYVTPCIFRPFNPGAVPSTILVCQFD